MEDAGHSWCFNLQRSTLEGGQRCCASCTALFGWYCVDVAGLEEFSLHLRSRLPSSLLDHSTGNTLFSHSLTCSTGYQDQLAEGKPSLSGVGKQFS